MRTLSLPRDGPQVANGGGGAGHREACAVPERIGTLGQGIQGLLRPDPRPRMAASENGSCSRIDFEPRHAAHQFRLSGPRRSTSCAGGRAARAGATSIAHDAGLFARARIHPADLRPTARPARPPGAARPTELRICSRPSGVSNCGDVTAHQDRHRTAFPDREMTSQRRRHPAGSGQFAGSPLRKS